MDERLSGYTVWLRPRVGDEEALSSVISDLASQHGGPRFVPHVTLLDAMQTDPEVAAESIAAIAAATHPFPLVLRAIRMEDVVWRSLYLAAEPTAELSSLRETARAQFGATSASYRPHLSLMYSDLDGRTRSRIAKDDVHIALPMEVVMDRVSLWQLDGPVEEWREVVTHPLHERRTPWTG